MKNKHLILAACVTLVACSGGGGGSSGGSSTTPTLLTGQFIDSAVQGLSYTTSTGQSGITGEGGTYSYQNGATVTFSIGGVTLGTVTAQRFLTPVDMVSANSISTSTAAGNMARFLMLLDTDHSPDNGITISPAVQTAAQSWAAINFNSPSFDADITAIVTQVTTLNGGGGLPTSDEAVAHLIDTYIRANAGAYTGTATGVADCFPDSVASPPGVCVPGPAIQVTYNWAAVLDPTTGNITGQVYGIFPDGSAGDITGEMAVFLASPGADPMGYPTGTAGFATFEGTVDKNGGTMSGTWHLTPNGNYNGYMVASADGTFTGDPVTVPEPACTNCTVYNGVTSPSNTTGVNSVPAGAGSARMINICKLALHSNNTVTASCRDLSRLVGQSPLETLTGTYTPGTSAIVLQNANGSCTVNGTLSGTSLTGNYLCTDGAAGIFNVRAALLLTQ